MPMVGKVRVNIATCRRSWETFYAALKQAYMYNDRDGCWLPANGGHTIPNENFYKIVTLLTFKMDNHEEIWASEESLLTHFKDTFNYTLFYPMNRDTSNRTPHINRAIHNAMASSPEGITKPDIGSVNRVLSNNLMACGLDITFTGVAKAYMLDRFYLLYRNSINASRNHFGLRAPAQRSKFNLESYRKKFTPTPLDTPTAPSHNKIVWGEYQTQEAVEIPDAIGIVFTTLAPDTLHDNALERMVHNVYSNKENLNFI